MADNIIRDCALSKELKTISVDDIKIGMIIHAIGHQTGSLGVKHKGEVKHLRVIGQLKSNGVKTVIVENATSSLLINTAKKVGLFAGVVNKLTFSKPEHVSYQPTPSSNELTDEFAHAFNLISKSELIYNKLADDIMHGKDIELRQVCDLAVNIYHSQEVDANAILTLSMIMDAKTYLANHALHTASLMCNFAKHLGMNKTECEKLAILGYVFDLGMLKVNKRILEKKEPLALEDQQAVKRHVKYSLNILRPLKLDSEFMLAVEQHHERLDGSGYPQGIGGSNVQKYSRMLAIVDAYDAMTSQRHFQKALSPMLAMQTLCEDDSGFDPKLAEQFANSIGPYPVGSLVILSCNKVGLVTHFNKHSSCNPKVKIFYDVKAAHFIEPKEIDLAKMSNLSADDKKVTILRPVLASEYGFTKESMSQV